MTGENEASLNAQHALDDEEFLTSRVIRLPPEAFVAFLAIVSAPATVVPEIVAIAARRAFWEIDGELGSKANQLDRTKGCFLPLTELDRHAH